ncbi:MAG TPA: vanadium-dependent haloperoxidase, partial [Gemmata sp.]
SEVATHALKVVWNQKWQVHLRLRPEAYGGLVHVQTLGALKGGKRPYGLPNWVARTEAAKWVKDRTGGLLLPMAFTPGSPTHPAYGAGHATVAGVCVTVLKAYFQTLEADGKTPVKLNTLTEREAPYGSGTTFQAYVTGVNKAGEGVRTPLSKAESDKLTIEGELNKLAMNVAMGRSMGGVHWRTDNTRSLMLGEALAARVLADITTDANEKPYFVFRSFSRKADGDPKTITIRQGRVFVDGVLVDTNSSAL